MYLKRLKDLREDFDKKQHEIAEFLNITRQQYSLYELGKRDIPAEFIRKLAKYYNTSADYILEITDEITPYINSNTKKKIYQKNNLVYLFLLRVKYSIKFFSINFFFF